MSELKEHQFCESDEFFREYHGPLSNETHLYYLKTEADKVIARHKYKRCLAMAELCDADACYQEMYIMDDKKATWFFNWEYKWRKLAEKFKEE